MDQIMTRAPARPARGGLFLPGILLVAVASGCLGTKDEAHGSDRSAWVAVDLSAYQPPTGEGALEMLASYVMTHPFRNWLHPQEQAASRDDLVTLLEDMGLRVERQPYDDAGPYSETGENILVFVEGRNRPDAWIVLGGHMDVGESDVYGAWDNGAGIASLIELARSGATRTFNHTIVYAFFDQQEPPSGRRGSMAFVEDALGRADLVAAINPDRPALNWPCEDGLVTIGFYQNKIDAGTPGYVELRDAVLRAVDAASVPPEGRESGDLLVATTLADAESFDQVDVPNVYQSSNFRTRVGPSNVPVPFFHTPLDTVEQMEAACGGRELLTQGFQVALDVMAATLAFVDAGLEA